MVNQIKSAFKDKHMPIQKIITVIKEQFGFKNQIAWA